jgi:hypothetical protein
MCCYCVIGLLLGTRCPFAVHFFELAGRKSLQLPIIVCITKQQNFYKNATSPSQVTCSCKLKEAMLQAINVFGAVMGPQEAAEPAGAPVGRRR